MKVSICIPAYNRTQFLEPLLQSIFDQNSFDFEIVIAEDCSPERDQITGVVRQFEAEFPGIIRYELNKENLGYDGNIRRLFELSRGEYCLFLGNDDLLAPNALQVLMEILNRVKDCGVIVRTYATFEENPSVYKQIFRYFPDEMTIAPGAQAITVAYRRSVVIPGMVIHRESAISISTDQFDGTLLYQLYLVGIILAKRSVVFTPEIIGLRRDGNTPDFGNSKSEQGKFTPKEQTPESSLHFMAGMLEIAKYVEQSTALAVYKPILSDIGAYSYPVLSIQAEKSKTIFIRYGVDLAKLGLWKHPLFYIYFALLLVFGPDRTDSVVKYIKQVLGYTPRLGALPASVK
jgi:glycosyltransferase involved in cell wall biosynthesis